jgi:uncharacterized protein with HEPN domain
MFGRAPNATPSMYSKTVYGALLEIRENIELARLFVAGSSYDSFSADRRSIYAVTCCLEIISEASRRLSDDIRSRHSGVPWRQIASAGNHYRHEYDNISPGVLWTTVQDSLGELELAVTAEIEAMAASGMGRGS